MDGSGGGRAEAGVLTDRRAVREAARRKRAAQGAAISGLSTVVVLGGLAALILTSKGWPNVRDTFFDWDAFTDAFPDVLQYQSDLALTHNNLGVLLAGLGKHDEARGEYEAVQDSVERARLRIPLRARGVSW